MGKVTFENKTDYSYTMKESLRAIRTNIQFLGTDNKVILFTSCFPNEGKSTVVMNLAGSLADSSKKVLVVDADIRKSVLVGRLKVRTVDRKEIRGLSHYLSGQNKLEEVIYQTNVPNVDIIFAGPSVVNPTELLEKNRFEKMIEEKREIYDYILVDCPPLGATIDAAVIAKNCDGAVLIVAQNQASSRMIASVKHQLENANVRILGAILNKVQMKKASYGSYYGTYYDSYYGDEGK